MEENNNGTPTKNSKKGLVLVLAIIVIALLAGAAYYFLGNAATPKDVFVGGIEKIFETSTKKLGEECRAVFDNLWTNGDESRLEKIAELQLSEEKERGMMSNGYQYH